MTRLGRRAAVAAAGVLALVGGAAPTSASAAQVAACSFQDVAVPSKLVSYVPPHTNGDRDFAGHGPSVSVAAYLVPPVESANALRVHIMDALETRSDRTHAHGTADRTILVVPPGWFLNSILTPPLADRADSIEYVDTDHADDIFGPSRPTRFVQQYRVVGDTAGDEAGTRTSVAITTKPVTVRLSNCP